MNVVFIGMPGSGKSTAGVKTAQLLKCRHIDTDEYIEKEHKSIPEIFAEGGEELFRDIETAAVIKLSRLDGAVISTGGGTVLRPENMRALKQNAAVTVYLKASLETLCERTKNGARPLLSGGGKRLQELFEVRAPLYQKYADLIIETDGLSADQIAKRVTEFLQEQGG